MARSQVVFGTAKAELAIKVEAANDKSIHLELIESLSATGPKFRQIKPIVTSLVGDSEIRLERKRNQENDSR